MSNHAERLPSQKIGQRLSLMIQNANQELTFAKLQLVENGSFTSGIETDHQDPHLLLAKLQSSEERESELPTS